MAKIKYLLLFFLLVSSLFAQGTPKKIKLQLQWKHQFEFAGFYMAKEKGYYKDIGVNVEFIEYENSTDIIQTVLDGEADFGLTYSSLISEYLNSKPLTFIANYFKQSPLVIVAHKDIQTPRELAGKRVMGISNAIDTITLKLMLEKFGVTLSDIENIPATFNIDDFVKGKVDAMSAFSTNEVYQLDKAGIKYNIFNPTLYGHEYYDVNLFSSSSFAKANPKLIREFKEASNRGWRYALKHKEEAVELIQKKYNTQKKSKDALLFEANQIEQLMLVKSESIGSIDPFRVEFIAKNFIETGYASKSNLEHLDDLIFDYDKISYSSKKSIQLTQDEQEYLDKKTSITMCVDPDWEPYEKINTKGIHEGIAADFIRVIEKRISKKIELIKTESWEESLQLAKEGKCEILSFLNQTPQRDKYLNFTPSLYSEPEVIIAQNEVTYLNGVDSLKEKTVAVIKGYRVDEYLKDQYPNMKIVYVKNNQEAITRVVNGSIDTTIAPLLGAAHLTRKMQLVNVKIAGKTGFEHAYKIGVIKSETLLHSILSKAVLSISEQERDKIVSNWVSVKFDQAFNYKLLLQILAAILIIFFIMYYRQRTIKKLNLELTKKLEKQFNELLEKDRMIFQQNKLASMGEMIENIAHQWRQPLAQINAAVMSIDDIAYDNGYTNKKLEKELRDIERTTAYMSRTIDDFKKFISKSNSDELFSLESVLHNSMSIISKSLEEYNIDVTINIDKKLLLQGSSSEFTQVLLILLNNAKEAIISQDVNKGIIHCNGHKRDDKILLTICDNGGGVSEDIVEKIFEPYFTTKHKAEGTGLGLYISKMIIESKFKGRLSLENTPQGACFFIEFQSQKESS